ncbi:hypothetical protein AB4Y87_11325 [Paenarthrobacter sp. RAF54_2]|uniref:hypothetical protein n=1 Tax=Paenarthrobacter sp. RAF54_2 TaxID=3233061 RepID=UPI003F9CBECC
MSTSKFQTIRREALRKQLVELPTVAETEAAARFRLPGKVIQRRSKAAAAWNRYRVWLAAAVVGAATVAGTMALTPTPEDRFEDASRIISSLTNPQQDADKVPPGALSNPESLGIDASQTRLLGHSDSYTYYGAPATEADSMPGTPSGKRICIISVPVKGQRASIGCTLLKGFEGAGLKFESPDRAEAAWLLVPAGIQEALTSVASENGWAQQAPNFLVRNSR